MYPEESVRACCGHVALLHLTSGDGRGVGVSLRNGSAPCSVIPNADPADTATAALLSNRTD